MAGLLLTAAADAGLAIALAAACLLIGFSLLPRRTRARARLGVPLAFSLGLTAAGCSAWLAGSVVGTRAVVPVLAVLLAQSLRTGRVCAAACRRWARTAALLLRSRPWLAAPIALALLAVVPQLLLPVTDSDGLRYHLALPKLYLLAGRVTLVPFEYHGALPQLPEMLYLVGLTLGRAETAAFLHALAFVAALGVVAACVHRGRATRSAALLAAFALAATPVAVTVAATAFVDHIAVFHCTVALLAAAAGAPPALVGIALAGALGTKLTTAPFAAGLALAVIAAAPRGARLRAALALAVPAALVLGPFAVRNAAATGDPFFPLGRALLGLPVAGTSAATFAYAAGYHAKAPGFLGIAWGAAQGTSDPTELAGWHNLAALFALALAVRDRRARAFALPVAATLLLGLAFRPPTRYLLPMLAALAALGAMALARLRTRWAIAAGALAVIPSLATAVPFLLEYRHPFDLLSGRVDRAQFLARNVPGWRAAALVNAQPPGGTVMALDFPAPYFFDRPWIGEGLMGTPPLQEWVGGSGDAAGVLRRLAAEGVRYLVVTPGYGGGTPATMLPLAASPGALERVGELRAALVSIGSRDGVDVFFVPAAGTVAGPPGAGRR